MLRAGLGRVLGMLGRREEAIAQYAHASQVGRLAASDWYNYAVLLRTLDPFQAREAFRKSTEVDPEFAQGWIQWGIHDLYFLEIDGALSRFKEVRRLIGVKKVPMGLPLDEAEQYAQSIWQKCQSLLKGGEEAIAESGSLEEWAYAAAVNRDYFMMERLLDRASKRRSDLGSLPTMAAYDVGRMCCLAAMSQDPLPAASRKRLLAEGLSHFETTLDDLESILKVGPLDELEERDEDRALSQLTAMKRLLHEPTFMQLWKEEVHEDIAEHAPAIRTLHQRLLALPDLPTDALR
jgi:tetratricopeptide (TPR) repeat protein